MKTRGMLSVLVVALAAGCSSEPPAYWSETTPAVELPSPTTSPAAVSASMGCLSAMAAAEQEVLDYPDGSQDAALRRTADACGSVDEWRAALTEHPGALGTAPGFQVDPEPYLAALCYENVATMCTEPRG